MRPARPASAALIALLLAGCTPAVRLAETPVPAPTKAPYTAAPPPPTWKPAGSPAGRTHGPPYQPADIALALQTVPPSFPAQLRTRAMTVNLAASLAAGIWTYDGRPYGALYISGSCGEGPALRCEVFVEGVPLFAKTRDDEDVYQWVATEGWVRPLGEPSLGGYPAELDGQMDALARSLDREGALEGLTMIRMGWAPAPMVDGFILRYTDGNLERGTTLLVTVDRQSKRIVRIVRALT